MGVTKDNMVNDLKELIKIQEDYIAKEYGFDEMADYDDEQLYFVKYAISKCNGLKNKVKVAKCLYVVDQLINCIVSEDNSYKDIGKFACDVLEDVRFIQFSSYETEISN